MTLTPSLAYVSTAVTKFLGKATKEGGVYFGLQFECAQSITVGKQQWQKHEVAGWLHSIPNEETERDKC
jgi:hypothetical protein